MKENREIARAMEEAKRAGRKMALATVVRVKGSAYRREGAKLLIDEDGNTVGVISGGCLEPDVAETAKKVMADGRPVLKSYELDEELVWGLGLGMSGNRRHLDRAGSGHGRSVFLPRGAEGGRG